MILYVGKEELGFFIAEVASRLKEEVIYMDRDSDISTQVNSILQLAETEHIIYDIDQYTNPAEEIVDIINRIHKTNHATVIILASGYMADSRILMQFRHAGFHNIITATAVADLKDQLQKCLNGYYDNNPDLIIPPEIEEKLMTSTSSSSKLIGVAGSCHRIGTTTFALQLVKYLTLKGFRAAYIQMNSSNYIQHLLDWFEVNHDEEIGKVTYLSTDQFYNLEKLSDILRLDYDYFIYDYSNYSDTDFNKTSFLEKDLRYFVVGASPSEMPYTLDLIQSSFYQDVTYIYNFVPETDQKEVLELMESKSDQTFFTGYAPDPYTLTDLKRYEEILPLKQNDKSANSKVKKQKPFHFFRR